MNSNILFLSIFFLLLVSLMACKEADSKDQAPEPENLSEAGDPENTRLTAEQMELAGIETGRISLRPISSYIECSGQIEVPPKSLYSVYAPINAFIRSVQHLPGEYIEKGSLLTSLSHPDLIHLQRDYLVALSQLGFLESEFNRKSALAEQEAGSQKAFEEAKANFQGKQAQLKGLKAELELLGISPVHLEEKGEIQSQLNLYAPISGYLSKVEVNQGKLVHPDELLFEIIDPQHLHLELQVFAKDLPKIRSGQRIEAQIPGSAKIFPAEVFITGKTIDPEKKTAIVHGHLEEEGSELMAGMYFTARIIIAENTVPAIPETALVQRENKSFVFVSKDGRFEKIAVQTGITDGGYVELLDWNLPDDTEIVRKGAYYIREEGE